MQPHGTVTMRLQTISPKTFKGCTVSGGLVRSVEYFSELGGLNLRCAGNIGPLKAAWMLVFTHPRSFD